jgi:uncharacterized protein (TIGR00255 family)
MTVVSMTGFAESSGAQGSVRWRWEVKSVNGRGLDLRLRTPPGFDGIEPAARMLANERLKRGSLQATLTVEPQDGARGLRVDPQALAAAVRIAREIQQDTGLPPPHIDGLLALKGVIIQDEALPMDGAAKAARDAAVLETFAVALDALARARVNEGQKLHTVMTSQIDQIARLTTEASKHAATQPVSLRDKLKAQLDELLAPGAVSADRLELEIAMLAARADVREELDRLNAHIDEARALIHSNEAVGRKLDFLAQEFNREANTLCSKSSDASLTRVGLALKAAIDQFREQAQNVE